MGIQIFLIFVFIILNGIFAASEIAIVSVSETRVSADAEAGKKNAQRVLNFVKSPTKFLSTIQIGITMFGFLNGAIAADAFSESFTNLILNLEWIDPSSVSIVRPLTTFIITLILTFVQVVVGELVPKRLAMRAPEKVAYTFVSFINVIRIIMKPFVALLTGSANLIIRMFGINPLEEDQAITEEELRMMLRASQRKGVIDTSENEMIQNIFEFDNSTVSDVMTHRTEVSAINVKATKDEVINIVANEKYTRFPVYKDTIDSIIGILHAKDLIRFFESKAENQRFSLKRLLRPAYYVPDSKNTRELFKEMQFKKQHIAVVIDEYGGTAGIVTFEDLIEEIVGNIFDEYDDDDNEIELIKKDQYEIDGLTDIEDVEDLLHCDLPIDEYDTLSGFVLGQLGRFPEDDEDIIITYHDYKFEALEYENRVIGKVRVTKLDNEIVNASDKE